MRFPGFEGEWETKKLGEIAKFSKGKGISKSDIEENGVTECIRYGELYTHYREVINEIRSTTNIDKSTLVLSEENDVIIPASGETTIDIATASCVLKSGIALGGDLNIIKTKINGIFLSYYLNSKKKIEIANLAQGISVVHLYSSQLASLSLSLPKLNEQNRISSFLALLDKRIQTQNKIIEQLETLIKGLSEKLFSQGSRFKNYKNGWKLKNL
ncbi:restriction endonuclease subunit S, partial [Chryseobacterium sp. CKR4-1]|uniref:restriction endonuclease subunit S n=1 Tax=Chryseobacterium sp. CKR4-1 TaxID=3068896 RepID=UPI0027966FCA